MENNENLEFVAEETEINQYTNPNKKRMFRSIYYFIAAVFLWLPMLDFSKNLRRFLPDVYRNFGELVSEIDERGLKTLTVVLICAAVWLCFNILVFCVFEKLYQKAKPYNQNDIEKLSTLLSDTFLFNSNLKFYENLKNLFLLKAFISIKSGFCKEFKEELINSALEELYEKDNFNLYAVAKTFSLYSPYISRENKVIFSRYLMENAEELNEIKNEQTDESILEIIFDLQKKTETPFILEPAREKIAESFRLDFYYLPYEKAKKKRKFDFKIKLISFAILCALLVATEVYAVLLIYAFPFLNDLLLDNFLLSMAILALLSPVLLVDGLFVWITACNKNPKHKIDNSLLKPFSQEEIVIKPVKEKDSEIITDLSDVPAFDEINEAPTEPEEKPKTKVVKKQILGANWIETLQNILLVIISVALPFFRGIKKYSVLAISKLRRLIKGVSGSNFSPKKITDNLVSFSARELRKRKADLRKLKRFAHKKRKAIEKAKKERAEKQEILREERAKKAALERSLKAEKQEILREERAKKAALERSLKAEKQVSQKPVSEKPNKKQKSLTEKQKKQVKKLREERAKLQKERQMYMRKMALKQQVERNKQIARQQKRLKDQLSASRQKKTD